VFENTVFKMENKDLFKDIEHLKNEIEIKKFHLDEQD
jgi:hypothetical protein